MIKYLKPILRHARCLTAIGAGLLLATAFPKFSLAGFAWIAPALIAAAAHGRSGRESFRLGYFSGLAFWLASLYWLLLMPATGFPILGWLALAAFVALFFGVWVWIISTSPFPISDWTSRTLWALGGAAAWVALEMVRARLFSGFPWSFLGVSQYQLVPLIQLAAFTGVYGVSFLVVWFSLALYSAGLMILRRSARRHLWQAEIVLPMVVVVSGYIGGYFAMKPGEPAGDLLRVTAIQPSVPQTLIWSSNADASRFQELLDLSQAALNLTNHPSRTPSDGERGGAARVSSATKTDLLLWPESAVPFLDDATYRAINDFARSHRVWIILNGDDVEFHPTATNFFNAAFLIGPDGRWRQAYHKRDLVIFGEYVPLANWLPFLKWLTPITGGWTPGDKPATFEITRDLDLQPSASLASAIPINISPLICFEDTFPGTAREAAQDDVDLLVNLTNDGWFGQSAEQWQHLANSLFRAVENGLPLLRCANNGVTCLIDRHGRIVQLFRDEHRSEYGPGSFTVDIPLRPAAGKPLPTFYHRHGDWFGWGCVGITFVLLGRKFIAIRKP